MKKYLLGLVAILMLGVSGCGKVSGPANNKQASTSSVAKQTTYSDEEYAMAAFYQAKDQSVAVDQLRVLARADGLFISDIDSDTQGYVMTVKASSVQATDANGKTTSYTKADLKKLLKTHHATYTASLKQGKKQEKAAQADAKKAQANSASSQSSVSSSAVSTSKSSSVSSSSASSASDASTTVDVKNLTTAQLLAWVKVDLISNGADPAALADPDKVKLDSQFQDGYAEVLVYEWNGTHTFQTLSYTYRVDQSGQLQKSVGADFADTGTPYPQ
ncbi:hypothetical protein [Lacticaseibacillus sp. GG6-2]